MLPTDSVCTAASGYVLKIECYAAGGVRFRMMTDGARERDDCCVALCMNAPAIAVMRWWGVAHISTGLVQAHAVRHSAYH